MLNSSRAVPAGRCRGAATTGRGTVLRSLAVASIASTMAATAYGVSVMTASAAPHHDHTQVTGFHAGHATFGWVVGRATRPGYTSGWIAYKSGAVIPYGGAPDLGTAPSDRATGGWHRRRSFGRRLLACKLVRSCFRFRQGPDLRRPKAGRGK